MNDAAMPPDEPAGLGAMVAMFGPIVLVVFLIVVFRIGGDDAAATPKVTESALPAAGVLAPDTDSMTSKEAEAAVLEKLIQDSEQNAAAGAQPGAPAQPLATVPAGQWAPPPAPGAAYWGPAPQGGAPQGQGGYPPHPYYGYPPNPYQPYGADPYWWMQRQPQAPAPRPAQ
ncbi:MAG: hypothetical protein AAF493_21210 [Pseudomonadota bacterium]